MNAWAERPQRALALACDDRHAPTQGRLQVVGAVLEPIPVNAFDIIMTRRSISGSPNGSPLTMAHILEFSARHNIRRRPSTSRSIG